MNSDPLSAISRQLEPLRNFVMNVASIIHFVQLIEKRAMRDLLLIADG